MNEMIALAAGLLLAGYVLYAAYKRAYERQIGRALHGRPVRVYLPEMRTVMRAYLMLCVILAFSWLSILIGVTSNSPEGASSLFTLVIVLPYLSSGFVPLDAMPGPLAAFARYQPMTPVIETMRNAFQSMPLDIEPALISLLWCIGLTGVFCFCSLLFFRKRISQS